MGFRAGGGGGIDRQVGVPTDISSEEKRPTGSPNDGAKCSPPHRAIVPRLIVPVNASVNRATNPPCRHGAVAVRVPSRSQGFSRLMRARAAVPRRTKRGGAHAIPQMSVSPTCHCHLGCVVDSTVDGGLRNVPAQADVILSAHGNIDGSRAGYGPTVKVGSKMWSTSSGQGEKSRETL